MATTEIALEGVTTFSYGEHKRDRGNRAVSAALMLVGFASWLDLEVS